jgi:hypothetical protein
MCLEGFYSTELSKLNFTSTIGSITILKQVKMKNLLYLKQKNKVNGTSKIPDKQFITVKVKKYKLVNLTSDKNVLYILIKYLKNVGRGKEEKSRNIQTSVNTDYLGYFHKSTRMEI